MTSLAVGLALTQVGDEDGHDLQGGRQVLGFAAGDDLNGRAAMTLGCEEGWVGNDEHDLKGGGGQQQELGCRGWLALYVWTERGAGGARYAR